MVLLFCCYPHHLISPFFPFLTWTERQQALYRRVMTDDGGNLLTGKSFYNLKTL